MARTKGATAKLPKKRTSLTEDKLDVVVSLIANYGASVRAACAEAGVPFRTMTEARKDDESIAERLNGARSKFQFTAERTVAEYIRGDLESREQLKAAQWWLGMRARYLYNNEITVRDKPINAWMEVLNKAREQTESDEANNE